MLPPKRPNFGQILTKEALYASFTVKANPECIATSSMKESIQDGGQEKCGWVSRVMLTSRFSYKNTSSLQHPIHWDFKTMYLFPCRSMN